MIDDDKLRLPVCAFGAGAVHVVAIALVLPVLITLPASGESMTPNLAAIPVDIVPVEIVADAPAVAPMPPVERDGDAIGALLENVSVTATPEPAGISGDTDDITGSLPEAAPVEPVPSDVAPSEVANIAPEGSSFVVPVPLRKPNVIADAEKEEAKTTPREHVSVRKPRARSAAKSQPVFKGFLGGRRATTMQEYRPPGQ